MGSLIFDIIQVRRKAPLDAADIDQVALRNDTIKSKRLGAGRTALCLYELLAVCR